LTRTDGTSDKPLAPPSNGRAWTVVIPVFNEQDFIEATLHSLSLQTMKDFKIIIVDNGSTDNSATLIEQFKNQHDHLLIEVAHERTPGQAAALKNGIAKTTSELIAICDADTIYPPHYLQQANSMFNDGGPDIVAALAFSTKNNSGWKNKLARLKGWVVSSLLTKQCHAGGYAHTFRTHTLKTTGGYDRALWPYCLKDHELMHRISKQGTLVYDFNFWCLPSDRRNNRQNVRWTLFERILYHATPYARKDWFFYEFLKPRFEARGLSELKLRQRDWESLAADD